MKKILFLIVANILYINSYCQKYLEPINSKEAIEKGIEYHDKNEYKNAIKEYEKVTENDTNYAWALFECALSCRTDSQYVKAREICQKGIALKTSYSHDFLIELANIYDIEKNYTEAEKNYELAIKQFPNSYKIYYDRAISQSSQEKYPEAEQNFQKALLMNPYSAASNFYLGKHHFSRGNTVQSFLSLINFLIISPNDNRAANAINMLHKIANGTTDYMELVSKRKKLPQDEDFSDIESIVHAKIALDKNYKLKTGLDDPIIRQLQAIAEVLSTRENSSGFYNNYYIPYYNAIYKSEFFEPFTYTIASGLNIEKVNTYVKKNNSDITKMNTFLASMLQKMGYSRNEKWMENDYSKPGYFFEEGRPIAKGIYNEKEKLRTGQWEIYNKHGITTSLIQFNNAGRLHGTYTYFFDSGIKNEEGTFNNGEKEGDITEYYDNGNIRKKVTLKNKTKNGVFKNYFYNGTIASEETMVDDKLQGKSILYYKNGNKKYEYNCKDDKIEGPLTEYFWGGQVSEVYNYKNGKKEGEYTSSYSDGKIHKKGTYINDKEEGETIVYFNDIVVEKQHISNNEYNGTFTTYNSLGKESYVAEYKNGKKQGIALYKNNEGKVWCEEEHNKGHIRKLTYYDVATNKIIHQDELDSKEYNNIITYDNNGNKNRETICTRDGLLNGADKKYYLNGKILEECKYKNGNKEGTLTAYYENGNKKYEENYIADKLNGYFVNYNIDGSIKSEGWYKDNELDGVQISYNELKKIKEKEYYISGQEQGTQYYYYNSGKLKNKLVYDYGNITKQTCYDTTGDILTEIEYKTGTTPITIPTIRNKKFSTYTMVNNYIDGVYTSYYPDGSIFQTYTNSHGQTNGTFIENNPNGTLHYTGKYINDTRTGTWLENYHSGEKYKTEEYVDGKLHGVTKYYHQNGTLEIEKPYLKNERNGMYSRYSNTGELMYKIYYEDDIPLYYTYENKEGKLVDAIKFQAGAVKLVAYYKNGTKSADIGFESGVLHGDFNLFYPNGKPAQQSSTVYNNFHGAYKEYHSNGQVHVETNYYYDSVDGTYKKYNEKGILIEEAKYIKDLCDGDYKYYTNEGKLTVTNKYYLGTIYDIIKN